MSFLLFPESEVSENRLPSVFVRAVSPVERVSGKTPKNLRLYRWLVLFCPRLSPLPFLLLPNLRLSPDPLPLPLFFPSQAYARPFPFSFPLVVKANLLTGLPDLVSAWFLHYGGSISLQWSPDLEDHSPFYKRRHLYPLSPLSKNYHGYFILVQVLVVQENKLKLVEDVVKSR